MGDPGDRLPQNVRFKAQLGWRCHCGWIVSFFLWWVPGYCLPNDPVNAPKHASWHRKLGETPAKLVLI